MEATLVSPTGRIVLGPTGLTIGRGNDNQLMIYDSQASTHHAAIRWIGERQLYSIIDLGSANGTFVNEQQLDHTTARLLNAGDRIRIGQSTFIYEASDLSQGVDPTVVLAPPPSTSYGWKALSDYSPDYSPYAPSALPSYVSPPSYDQPSAIPPPPPYAPTALSPSVSSPSYDQPSNATSLLSSPPFPPKQNPRRRLRIALISVVIFVVLGTVIGTLLLLHPRPQPWISASSNYNITTTPVGAIGTVFHIRGQQFSNNSTVAFLLDGKPAPGNGDVQSDANGAINANLTVTKDWAEGRHLLTARDTNNAITQVVVAVMIVPQGQAHTAGPNGAPADDTSFSLKAVIQRKITSDGEQLQPLDETLLITGRPDPKGGTVCQTIDDGQAHTINDKIGDISYTEVFTFTCSGIYKAGKLFYTQSLTSDKFDFGKGLVCSTNAPLRWEYLEGSFTDQNTISGTYTSDAEQLHCNTGDPVMWSNAQTGSWTATTSSGGTSL